MRIAVVGLGGVGGYIAASLASTSHDILGLQEVCISIKYKKTVSKL